MEHVTRREEIAALHLDGVTARPPLSAPLAPHGRRPIVTVLNVLGAVTAWLVILGLAGLVVYRNMAASKAEAGQQDSTAWLVSVESQGRYLVGMAHLGEQMRKTNPAAAKQLSKAELFASAKGLNRGSYSQRLRYAILAGELDGPAEARALLETLEEERTQGMLQAREVSVEAVRLLDRLYEGYEFGFLDPAMTLDAAEQQKLRDGLRWYGDLALAPEGGSALDREEMLAPAVRTAVGYLLLTAGIFVGILGGLVAIGIVVWRTWRGKLLPALTTGSGHGGVYAETFALYLLIFFGLSLAARNVDLGQYGLLATLGAMLVSLAALVWPVLRGVGWRQVREEVGLTFAGKPLTRLLLGPATWLAALPMAGLGMMIMLALMRLLKQDPTQPGVGPSHPIVNVALQKDWWVWLQIFLVAAVGAPVVEEVMFRGVLYRHVRELTGRLGVWWSVACAVLVTGFVFAVIHPQGWLGVLILLPLATAFALAREWQRSLVSSIFAHSINNGMALLLLWMTAG